MSNKVRGKKQNEREHPLVILPVTQHQNRMRTQNLAIGFAIVDRAIKDYVISHNQLFIKQKLSYKKLESYDNPQSINVYDLYDTEAFFRSEWFRELTYFTISPDWIIPKLEEIYRIKEDGKRKSYTTKLSNYIYNQMKGKIEI